jgi:predicted AAA+ superfamily ATPase
MYQRLLEPPDHSFFLFGPRSTGKSTWLGQALPGAYRFDLLDTALYLELSRRPAYFTEVVEALDPRTWVVVDEVQRIPTLLNHIHALIAKHGNRHRFALSGSNARKLRRLDANLLAGRVFTRNMFPLVTGELGADGGAARRLEYGSLPKVAAEPAHAVDILRAYVLTYLQQEIQQEALVKDTGAFSRFLEVAALMNGQTVNVASLARDSGVARPTVQRYFEVLIDTLVGTWVRAWQPKARIKETAHPRFYFFDPGVVRAIAGRLEELLDSAEKGPLFETLVLHELRAADSYRNLGGRISYWRTPSGSEVDFIWSRGRRHVGFEVKSATAWRPEWSRTLNELLEAGILEAAYGVYLGTDRLVQGSVRILPFDDFATGLYARDLLVAPKS